MRKFFKPCYYMLSNFKFFELYYIIISCNNNRIYQNNWQHTNSQNYGLLFIFPWNFECLVICWSFVIWYFLVLETIHCLHFRRFMNFITRLLSVTLNNLGLKIVEDFHLKFKTNFINVFNIPCFVWLLTFYVIFLWSVQNRIVPPNLIFLYPWNQL